MAIDMDTSEDYRELAQAIAEKYLKYDTTAGIAKEEGFMHWELGVIEDEFRKLGYDVVFKFYHPEDIEDEKYFTIEISIDTRSRNEET